MTKENEDFLVGKSYDLIASQSCCPELKMAAQQFIDSVGSDEESTAAKRLIGEVEEDISPIDHVIDLFGSKEAIKLLGEERAANMKDHAVKIKAKGAKYCDCAACAACEAILAKKDEILS